MRVVYLTLIDVCCWNVFDELMWALIDILQPGQRKRVSHLFHQMVASVVRSLERDLGASFSNFAMAVS